MEAWAGSVQSVNLISLLIMLVAAASVLQGAVRGGGRSARHLALLVTGGVLTALSLLLAWTAAQRLSPWLQAWLTRQNLTVPRTEISGWEQAYYTIITSVRDFPLLRFGIVFLLACAVLKTILNAITSPLVSLLYGSGLPAGRSRHSLPGRLFSSFAGALIGLLTGTGRALVLIAALFVYTTFFPQAPLTGYIQKSGIYQKGADEVIQPFTGEFIAEKVPVFTRAVENEFSRILQRKYEVLDARVPDDISQAARAITANATTDEEKARLLYQWVGTRVQYDWDKVRLYENDRIWKEQTPEETFTTRKGVCIDYSRLYAVMARSVGLQVKVETGLGYDGQGGYGPHAWNVVYLSEKHAWVPLDTTWKSSGGNWFNPPHFYDTHIKDA